jgi:hypothetical protein
MVGTWGLSRGKKFRSVPGEREKFLVEAAKKSVRIAYMIPKQLEGHAFKAGERIVGRQKGTPNHLTASIKDAIYNAFTELGGTSYLVHVGRNDPRTFCALLSKLLPTKLANADGSPLLAALTELTDAQLEARTARALADAQRAGLMGPPDGLSGAAVLDVQAEIVEPVQGTTEAADQ